MVKLDSLFQKDLERNYNELKMEFYNTNEHFKKAQELCDKYNMTSFDDMARANTETIEFLRTKIQS